MWFITFGLPFWIIVSVIVLNLTFVLTMIFIEAQNPDKFFKWAAVLLLLPIIGFFFYLFFGKGPSMGRRKNVMTKLSHDEEYISIIEKQKLFLGEVLDWDDRTEDFISYNLTANHAFVSSGNSCELFTDMELHYQDMFDEISKAQEYIHICYFIWQADAYGKKLRDLLCERALAGVKVRVLYDDIGSLKTPKRFFSILKKSGGEVYAFTPSKFKFLSRNMNYRNHRKIVVIDGKIGYIGGANIGAEYTGKKKKVSPWRDSHLKVSGNIINPLNIRFLQDYIFSTGKKAPFDRVESKSCGNYTMQIISSGPDSKTPRIENTYIKAIYNARKHVLLQTPYLILDEAFKLALLSAVNSGVKVSIMIPGKPDKKSVYFATLAYALELQKKGVEILVYNGFLHAKTLLCDDEISSVGTFNLDIRSFKLHYEATALIYGEEFAKIMLDTYENDRKSCTVVDEKYLENINFMHRFAMRIVILFSPLL